MSMKMTTRIAVVGALVGGCIAGQSSESVGARSAEADARKAIQVTRVYSGSDGQSHAESMDAKLGAPDRLGMEVSEELKAKSTNFVRFPATFFEDWHCAHARRYVITLSGRGEAELAGGEKVAMEPGTAVLFEDFTGKGHISRALTADWTAVFVQLE